MKKIINHSYLKMFRKLANVGAKSVARSGFKAPVMTRCMSSVIERKEHADEARFIRDIEARRQEEIRANLERIMALDDSHEDKAVLVDLLDKKKDEGIIAKLGLNDWKFAVPVAVLLFVPAAMSDLIILDAEFQLSTTFLLFCATMYTQAGPMIDNALQSYGKDVEKNLRAVDDGIKENLVAAVDAGKLALDVEADLIQFNELKDNLKIVQAEALTNQEAHKYRDAVVKKLDALQALEESASNAIRARMINKVQSDVVNTFKNDAKAKESAFNQALAVLAGGANAKMGTDVVGQLFASSLVNYKTAYAKIPADKDEILKKLQEDMAAIAAAPVVESKGGNVYITHAL